jgi:hypothetical protein
VHHPLKAYAHMAPRMLRTKMRLSRPLPSLVNSTISLLMRIKGQNTTEQVQLRSSHPYNSYNSQNSPPPVKNRSEHCTVPYVTLWDRFDGHLKDCQRHDMDTCFISIYNKFHIHNWCGSIEKLIIAQMTILCMMHNSSLDWLWHFVIVKNTYCSFQSDRGREAPLKQWDDYTWRNRKLDLILTKLLHISLL